MTRTFVYSISAEESGTKIADYLRNHGYSRHILTCLKHTDDTVLVNGLGVYMNYVLQPDDRLTIVIRGGTDIAARAGYQYHCAGPAGIFYYI